jgi:phosphonate transport system substrate-binding protein
MINSRYVTRILLFLGLSVLLSACSSADAAPLPYVDLNRREPLPAIAPADVLPLRIAVAAIISPQGTAESYTDLANYLGDKLSRPVELIQRRTYAEVNDLVAKHEVDIAFVCTSAYVDGHDRFGMNLLVAPEIDGELVYYSELIVSADSDTQSIGDLRGKVFAFTDPMSFSGRVYPTYLLHQMGETPESFFSRTFFTYSHDRAIEAVAAGVADGAAVDSLVLAYAMKRDPHLQDRLRIIHRSPPFGIPPVVTPPDLSPRQKAQLQEVLLAMHKDPRGQEVLANLGIDRFVSVDDRTYEGVRQLIQETGALP